MKKIAAIVVLFFVAVFLVGCMTEGYTEPDNTVIEHTLFINSGSLYAGTFRDPVTGVWYILTDGGVTPRLERDGTLYITD